jgi:hypothetical protein
MTFILLEYAFGEFTFDLLNIDFKNTFSSLLYISISENDFEGGHLVSFDIFYYRQLRILFYKLMEKILKIK